MRTKLIIAGAAGALTLAGLGVALPALADGTSTTGAPSSADRIHSALSGLVSDGSITQDQADEVAATLSDAGIGDHHGPGGPGGPLALSTAATTLGMTEDDLRTALQADGATLASVAQAHGVAVDDLIAALVQAQTDRINQAVTDGHLTQDQADQRLAGLQQRVTDAVNGTGPHGGRPGGPGGSHGDDDGD